MLKTALPRLAWLALLLAACTRPPATTPAASVNLYDDPTYRAIATAQDERNLPALLPYLSDRSADYRAAAALALASVQAPAATPALLPLLRDPAAPVRRAAAYALGQTTDSTAVPELSARLAAEPDGLVRRYVGEALGRCVTRRTLPELWRGGVPADTARAAALAWGLGRAALRGLSTPESIRQTARVLDVPALPDRARLLAAVGLSRTRGQAAELARLAGPTLLRLATTDPYYAVRAAAATALGKTLAGETVVPGATDKTSANASQTAVNETQRSAALRKLAETDPDARVQVAALRALPWAGSAYAESRPVILRALQARPEAVALTAAEWLLAHGRGETGANFDQLAVGLPSWRVRAVLAAAALRLASPASRPALSALVQARYAAAASDYEKGFLLQALAEDPGAFDFLREQTFAPGQPAVVAGYGLLALLAQRRAPEFAAARQAEFAELMRRALGSGDVALISTAAEALADKSLYPAAQPADVAALRQAQARLTLPREVEAWQGIQAALDRLAPAAQPVRPPIGPAAQHPISWSVVHTIPVGQRVLLRTTRGDIVLELKVNDSPGAVASFVTLVRQGFYDGTCFHRVIPNFVAQGGDPRGDGSGSAPYTLRSELGYPRYEEGSVGLASAGKDTESCQFFITHLPVPHLDGRYPIFARVVEGMPVVQQLGIGDQIVSARLLTEQ